MAVTKTKHLTIEDYLDYDDGTDSHRYELVNGALVDMPDEMPINKTIVSLLFAHFLKIGVSPYCLAIGHDIEVQSQQVTARKPDLVVHSPESAAAILADRWLRLEHPAPRLVIEVVSNSQKDKRSYQRDYIDKRAEYEQRGILEYWIIDPVAEVVVVLTLADKIYQESTFSGDDRLVSMAFPTLNISANQVLLVGD